MSPSRRLVLLPSPLLPTGAYEPLAASLRTSGVAAEVAAAPRAASAPEVVRAWTAAAAGADVLLAHSNAGYLAPAVRAAACAGAAVLFVDAALPPAAGSTVLAPAPLRAHLAAMADADGLLPPWTRWWPAEELARVVPAGALEPLDRSCPRVPLGYFDSEVTAPAGWVEAQNAYLAYGDTYADELTSARTHGWPSARLAGADHLHHLWDPGGVARAAVELLSRLLTPRR